LKINKVGISYFQPKIFRLKTGFISKFGFLGFRILCFKDKTAENIPFKIRKNQTKMSNLDPLILDIFPTVQKCPFCPLRAVNFKHEMQNTKKQGCDHYALKTYF